MAHLGQKVNMRISVISVSNVKFIVYKQKCNVQ